MAMMPPIVYHRTARLYTILSLATVAFLVLLLATIPRFPDVGTYITHFFHRTTLSEAIKPAGFIQLPIYMEQYDPTGNRMFILTSRSVTVEGIDLPRSNEADGVILVMLPGHTTYKAQVYLNEFKGNGVGFEYQVTVNNKELRERYLPQLVRTIPPCIWECPRAQVIILQDGLVVDSYIFDTGARERS